VLRLLFDAPTPPKYCGAGVCLLGLLYLVGIIHWVLFLEIDAPFYISHDWWVDYNYYSTLGNAVKFGLIPFHSSNLVHTTTRFLAIPETMSFLSPQVILTRISQIRFTNQGYEHTIKPHEQRVL